MLGGMLVLRKPATRIVRTSKECRPRETTPHLSNAGGCGESLGRSRDRHCRVRSLSAVDETGIVHAAGHVIDVAPLVAGRICKKTLEDVSPAGLTISIAGVNDFGT